MKSNPDWAREMYERDMSRTFGGAQGLLGLVIATVIILTILIIIHNIRMEQYIKNKPEYYFGKNN